MSRVRQIRESVDTKLDVHADAFEATLRHTEDHVRDRIERGKQGVHRALDALKASIEKSKQFTEAHKQKIHAEIDDLKVQIALGKAEARDALPAARKRLHAGTRKMETEIDSALQTVNADVLDAEIAAYVRATDKLNAELDAAEARFASAKGKTDAAFDKRRQEMSQRIAEFKQRLDQRKSHTSERLGKFEEELRGGFDKITKVVKDLFA